MVRNTTMWLARGVVAVALTAGALVSAQSTAPQQASQDTGLLDGRVVDPSGDPVSRATVTLRLQSAEAPGARRPAAPRASVVPVRTDDQGRFVFTNVPAGQFSVSASKAGWLDSAYGQRRPDGAGLSVEMAEGQARNDVQITMWRPAVITGRVTDDNGDPLVNVEVRAVQLVPIAGRRQFNLPQRPQIVPRQKTDDEGMYRFSDLMPGDYVVAVLASVLSEPPEFAGAIRAAGDVPRSYLQTMSGVGTAPIVFSRATGVASGGRRLVGSLSDLSGVPDTDGAWRTYPTTFYPSALTQTGATVLHVGPGEVRAATDVHMQLVSAWQVSGVLHGPDGPAPWHAVHLVPADADDRPLVDVGTSVTDATGAFTFHGVPPGQYVARVIRSPWPTDEGVEMGIAGGTGAIPYVTLMGRPRSSGAFPTPAEPLLYAEQPVVVGDRHVRNLDLTLREGVSIRGGVMFEGTSPKPTAADWQQARVWPVAASGRDDAPIWPTGFSEDGRFATPQQWPGRYLLQVTPPPGWTLQSATYQGRDISAVPIDLTEDVRNVVITFTDRTPTLRGQVQVDGDVQAEDVTVLLFPTDRARWVDYGRSTRGLTSARVTSTGTFSVPCPADGEYYIVAIPEADARDWRDPATLATLSDMADRVRIVDNPPDVGLRLRRLR